ncbi:hypothetical protein [Nocardia huaxiensis]|uniref:Uncharacterized protein n=1 Tax=Nocardia huaxiensis TaxID=2755382 RepID=A0A7D6Z613_9NOCA|nr:hypothetical protein [Nocardia huaxiensis]QLY32364.1 hypothetical protein H0264_08965 [Nocardia huaxiensis]UFS93926.1 hypothetical protein LPY97_24455 [Nocardia huaxiensis]
MSKEIDRQRARTALETIKEQPVIAAIAALPVLAIVIVVGVVTNWFVALLLLIAFGGFVAWKGKLFG